MYSNEFYDILKHWKAVRERYKKFEEPIGKLLWQENLRCAIDIATILNQQGIEIPTNLWRDKWEMDNTSENI